MAASSAGPSGGGGGGDGGGGGGNGTGVDTTGTGTGGGVPVGVSSRIGGSESMKTAMVAVFVLVPLVVLVVGVWVICKSCPRFSHGEGPAFGGSGVLRQKRCGRENECADFLQAEE